MYCLVSDIHFHDWSKFSKPTASINSRLLDTINELLECAAHAADNDADKFVIAGDLFHKRGSIKPSVFNPVFHCIEDIAALLPVHIIAGNHDLESDDSNELCSAIRQLSKIRNVESYSHKSAYENGDVIMIPWIDSIKELKAKISDNEEGSENLDLIIHAPVDNVIPGIPDHGLTAEWLGSLDYRRVFAGHYHNHKDFGNGVYSIGSFAHQTWNDIGTKSGYLFVREDSIETYETSLPKFVDFHKDSPISDYKDNYVRIKGRFKDRESEKVIEDVMAQAGALAVDIYPEFQKPDNSRSSGIVMSDSIQDSVNMYIDQVYSNSTDEIKELADQIFQEAQ